MECYTRVACRVSREHRSSDTRDARRRGAHADGVRTTAGRGRHARPSPHARGAWRGEGGRGGSSVRAHLRARLVPAADHSAHGEPVAAVLRGAGDTFDTFDTRTWIRGDSKSCESSHGAGETHTHVHLPRDVCVCRREREDRSGVSRDKRTGRTANERSRAARVVAPDTWCCKAAWKPPRPRCAPCCAARTCGTACQGCAPRRRRRPRRPPWCRGGRD